MIRASVGPALTPEQWEEYDKPKLDRDIECATHEVGYYTPPSRHGLAALALHEQPFGFTWGNVDLLRTVAEDSPAAHAERLRELADRIAALLPPRARSSGE